VTWHFVVVFNSYEASVACVQRFARPRTPLPSPGIFKLNSRYALQDINCTFSGGTGTNLWGSGTPCVTTPLSHRFILLVQASARPKSQSGCGATFTSPPSCV